MCPMEPLHHHTPVPKNAFFLYRPHLGQFGKYFITRKYANNGPNKHFHTLWPPLLNLSIISSKVFGGLHDFNVKIEVQIVVLRLSIKSFRY